MAAKSTRKKKTTRKKSSKNQASTSLNSEILPNHTLPTGGTARYSSPLSVDDFVKKSSIIQYSPAALKNDARAVVQIATHEGLWAHARSVALRLKALLDAEQASVAGSAAAGVEDGEARGE